MYKETEKIFKILHTSLHCKQRTLSPLSGSTNRFFVIIQPDEAIRDQEHFTHV